MSEIKSSAEYLTVGEILRVVGETNVFSPAEAVTISGITAKTLENWYERNVLPKDFSTQTAPGHGRRRRYTIQQIIVLAVARELVDRAVPIPEAMSKASFHNREISIFPRNPVRPQHTSISREVFGLLEDRNDEEVPASNCRLPVFPGGSDERRPFVALYESSITPPASKETPLLGSYGDFSDLKDVIIFSRVPSLILVNLVTIAHNILAGACQITFS